MSRHNVRWFTLVVLLVAAASVACGRNALNPSLQPATGAPKATAGAPPLKVHMRSGDVVMLDTWSMSTDGATLSGSGVRYDALRAPRGSGEHALATDSIALIETNVVHGMYPGALQVLAALTIVTGSITAICTADPKGCFGSCPTFYVEGADSTVVQAEGFSASIARVLEARDIDALYGARVSGPRFSIRMRNEALETHAVRGLRLLAVPRPAGGRVYRAGDDRFYPAARTVAPSTCRAAEGDCLTRVSSLDSLERASLADSNDLGARETIELTFPGGAGPRGLVIGARNSLLSTFLFYQSIAYLGRGAGMYMAALERGGPEEARQAFGLSRALGGIEIEVRDAAGAWRAAGTFDEHGPIATDIGLFPLPMLPDESPVRIRLRLTKGNWRVGYVALAELGEPLTAVALEPVEVRRGELADSAALARLLGRQRHLVTYPGDAYRIAFDLPPFARTGDAELFLESEGFYYEWIRDEWLAEENPLMAAMVFSNPARALRRLAGPFKQREAAMEEAFWSSRFGR
jgi:hypothetical protein